MSRHRRNRRGLTLLEVLLSLAILGGALAVIGELMRVGTRNAEAARDLTTAQVLAETKLSEVTSGMYPLEPVSESAFDDPYYQADWMFSIMVQPVDQQGLVAVQVTVAQNPDVFSRPASFTLTRWMLDPEMMSLGTTAGGSGA